MVLILALVLGYLIYNYIYHEHRNIQEEPAEFVMNSNDLEAEFYANPKASEQKYLNKIIEVQGNLTDQNKLDLTLNNKVFCQFDSQLDSLKSNNIKVKGRFIGYDDLLDLIKMDHCKIETQNH
ncbi:OB-fold protein [Gaetbulibacter aestuarii]